MVNSKAKGKHSEKKFSVFRIISLIISILCISYIVLWVVENKINKDVLENIYKDVISVDEQTEKTQIDFNKLSEQNEDVVGWLKVNNTNIYYPIVKTNDNSFYLKHNFYKDYNIAGWIFADYRLKFDGTDKNIVIYGHNMKDGSMFGTLKNILTEQWYSNEENMYVTLETKKELLTYKIFSVYDIKKETYYSNTFFKTDTEYESFLNNLKLRSIKDFNSNLTKDDKILTLSTCASNNNYRVVLHAYLLNNIAG